MSVSSRAVRPRILTLLACWIPLCVGVGALHATPREPIWFFESAAWDISDDGLPFRVGVLLPSQHDPLSRLLRMREPRWMLGAGYAQIRDIYDTGTGQLTGKGGGGLLFGGGREWAWNVPVVSRPAQPVSLGLELGVNYATASLPANGTHFNFIVSPGLTWERQRPNGRWWHVGVRWFHLSNVDVYNVNAGYDGITVRVGRSW